MSVCVRNSLRSPKEGVPPLITELRTLNPCTKSFRRLAISTVSLRRHASDGSLAQPALFTEASLSAVVVLQLLSLEHFQRVRLRRFVSVQLRRPALSRGERRPLL